MNRPFHRHTSFAAAVILGLVIAKAASAQTPAARFVDSARVEIDRAVHDMDSNRLDGVRVLLDRALAAFPDDAYLLHYRGLTAYWQVVGLVMGGNKEQAAPIVSQGLDDLKGAERLSWPETIQLEAALNGFRIMLEPGLGPTLGPLTARLSAEAAKMGPENPRVFLLQAYLAESTPEAMGGGKERARMLVMKALSLFDKDRPTPLAPSWGREEAQTMARRLTK
jgi:hypothetical protein